MKAGTRFTYPEGVCSGTNVVVAALSPLAVLPIPSVSSLDCRADVVFVVDEERSISSSVFSTIMSFLSQVVTRLDIDTGNTRVALVTYSRYIRVAFNLNAHSSIKSVQSAISSVSHDLSSSLHTAAASAFDYVRTRMLTSAAGDRHSVRNIVVFVTDADHANHMPTVMVSIECIVLFIAQYLLSVGLVLVIRYFVKTIVVLVALLFLFFS